MCILYVKFYNFTKFHQIMSKNVGDSLKKVTEPQRKIDKKEPL